MRSKTGRLVFLLAWLIAGESLAGRLGWPAGIGGLLIGDHLSAVRQQYQTTERGGRGCYFVDVQLRSAEPWSAIPAGTIVEAAFDGNDPTSSLVWIILPIEDLHARQLFGQLLQRLRGLAVRFDDDGISWQTPQYEWSLTAGPTAWRLEIVSAKGIAACDQPRDFVVPRQ